MANASARGRGRSERAGAPGYARRRPARRPLRLLVAGAASAGGERRLRWLRHGAAALARPRRRPPPRPPPRRRPSASAPAAAAASSASCWRAPRRGAGGARRQILWSSRHAHPAEAVEVAVGVVGGEAALEEAVAPLLHHVTRRVQRVDVRQQHVFLEVGAQLGRVRRRLGLVDAVQHVEPVDAVEEGHAARAARRRPAAACSARSGACPREDAVGDGDRRADHVADLVG